MKRGIGRPNLICVELTAEGVDAVAEAVVAKLVERGIIAANHLYVKGGDICGLVPSSSGARGASASVLPEVSFLRLPDVLRVVPVSRATWYEGMTSGRFPKGIKLGPRVIVWRADDIRELAAKIGNEAL